MNKMISVVRHPQNKKNVWTWAQLHNQAVVKSLNCSLKHEKLKIRLIKSFLTWNWIQCQISYRVRISHIVFPSNKFFSSFFLGHLQSIKGKMLLGIMKCVVQPVNNYHIPFVRKWDINHFVNLYQFDIKIGETSKYLQTYA